MRNSFFICALSAMVLASCSQNEQFGNGIPSVDDPNVINFSSSTTRASVVDIDDVKKDGFTVYATSKKDAAAFYIDKLTYKVDGSSWTWYDEAGTVKLPAAPKWPIVATEYPMDFYGISKGITATASVAASKAAIVADITIVNAKADQKDHVVGRTEGIKTKPTGGKVPMCLNHITSKVNISAIAGENTKAFISQAAAMNIDNTAKYDIVKNAYSAYSGSDNNYVYFQGTPNEITDDVTPTVNIESGSETPAEDGHMFLLPQDKAAWNVAVDAPNFSVQNDPVTIGSYIGMQYRLVDATTAKNLVGMSDITTYPYDDLDAATLAKVGADYQKGGAYTGALYVKVGFPMAAKWSMGKGYTYNVKLGTPDSSGGIYVDDTYYDETGIDTGLPVDKDSDGDIDDDDHIDPKDPVASGDIHFTVTVSPWDDSTLDEELN